MFVFGKLKNRELYFINKYITTQLWRKNNDFISKNEGN